jgi:hypothetical protein
MASQSVYLSIEHPCRTCYQILLPVGMLLSEICDPVSVIFILDIIHRFVFYLKLNPTL